MATNLHKYQFDALLELKDAGLIAADAAAEVDAVAKILDMGLGYFSGEIVIDITAIEVDSTNETYKIEWQLSSSPTFASTIIQSASIIVGHATALAPGDVTSTVGRYILRVNNEWNGTIYRYGRLYTDVTGTLATGINYKAFMVRD